MSEAEQMALGFAGGPQTTQWQLETIQLVNWGGFDGYHHADFANQINSQRFTTMITGESGTGKSTLMDAYIAVMMPNNTRFNSASNAVGRGRARGEQERNELTYLQGKTDVIYDSVLNTNRDKLLRDASTARWSAIVVTFVDDNGQRFSAAKFYYLRASVAQGDSIKPYYVTSLSLLDPRKLTTIADKPFDKRAIKALYDDARIYDGIGKFQQALYSTLSIGAREDGAKAIELLARIQSGYGIKTVDDLFKELVLDKPATFDKADAALAHFDDIERAYEEIETAHQKMELLQNIPAEKKRFDKQTERVVLLETLAAPSDEVSPLALHLATYEADSLSEAMQGNSLKISNLTQSVAHLDRNLASLEAERAQTEDELRNSGSETAENLTRKISDLNIELGKRSKAHEDYCKSTKLLGDTPATGEAYNKLQQEADLFLQGFDEEDRAFQQERDDLKFDQTQCLNSISNLREEAQYYEGRRSNIPRGLNEARELIANVTDLSLDRLPFLGELIDLDPSEEHWRTAAEVTLHGLARTLLIEKSQFERVSRLIDKAKLNVRINFQSVDTNEVKDNMPPAGTVAGKLLYSSDSPFTPWVRSRLADSKVNALCVDSPTDLGGGGLRVTAFGQTRQKSRGAHGRNRQEGNVIGFDNRKLLSQIAKNLTDQVKINQELNKQIDEIEKSQKSLAARRDAYRYVNAKTFEEIDIEGVTRAVTERQKELDAFLASHHLIDELLAKKERIVQAIRKTSTERGGESSKLEQAERLQADWSNREDACTAQKQLLEQREQIAVNESQLALLDDATKDAANAYSSAEVLLTSFPQFCRSVRELLDKQKHDARLQAQAARTELERTFKNYQNHWEDNDLGTDIASYDDYFEILEQVRAQKLYDQADEWLEGMHRWIVEDLIPVSDAYETAIRDIEDRLDPINHILKSRPFGPKLGHLRIVLRESKSESTTQFRRQLAQYASLATETMPDKLEKRHHEIRLFMNRLRKREHGGTGERDALLDRHRQVMISAQAIWPEETGLDNSVYMQLGEKSGGEVQELIAFILGSALLYRLNDGVLSRPRFSPVMLDEGFIKADSSFSQRAVHAWTGFGFQLIIATPNNKVEAFAPSMDRILTITKNTQGCSFVAPQHYVAPEQ